MPLPPPRAPPIVRPGPAHRGSLRGCATTNACLRSEVEWKVRVRKSWIWTWLQACRFVRAMDEDAADLVVQLCTRIGMIMEDASVEALTIRGVPAEEREQALTKLAAAGEQISALFRAAISIQSHH